MPYLFYKFRPCQLHVYFGYCHCWVIQRQRMVENGSQRTLWQERRGCSGVLRRGNASSSGHRIWCWEKYVNRAKERQCNEGNRQGQPEGLRINNSCLKQRVPEALVPVDANSLSRIAVWGSSAFTLSKQEITITKCTGRRFLPPGDCTQRSLGEYLVTLDSQPVGLFISASWAWELGRMEEITYRYTRDRECKFAIPNSSPWELRESLLCELQRKHWAPGYAD